MNTANPQLIPTLSDLELDEINEEIKVESGTSVNAVEHMFAFIRDGTQGQLQVELNKSDDRPASPKEIEQRWRDKVGDIAGTKALRFSSGMHMGGGPPIALALKGIGLNLPKRVFSIVEGS